MRGIKGEHEIPSRGCEIDDKGKLGGSARTLRTTTIGVAGLGVVNERLICGVSVEQKEAERVCTSKRPLSE